jgi:hypothetical protein
MNGRLLGALAVLAWLVASPAIVSAEPYFVGAGVCEECHRAEHKVWEGTKHFESFRTAHKNDKADAIAEAVGDKNMRKSDTCALCHYTLEQKDASSSPRARSGPSCESCHGAASDWVKLHNDYGGPSVKRDQEPPEHKAERIKKAAAAGMIWSSDRYGIAENCMTCHGMNNPALAGDVLAKMLGAGHPLNPDFELVRYSQGTVRHRFYPPDLTVNAELEPAGAARMFVEGQAAKLVSAVGALSRSSDAKYQAAQKKRADDARAALGKVASVSEAAALVADPTAENARKLVTAIAGKDLTAEVGGLLPKKDSYK